MIKQQSSENELIAHERECIHRRTGARGDYYSGESYVEALKRLRGEQAVKMANKVGTFFWADASRTKVWLCVDCVEEISRKA